MISGKRYIYAGLGMIFILMALRLVMLVLTPLELGGDEAQYWAWSQICPGAIFQNLPLLPGLSGFPPLFLGIVKPPYACLPSSSIQELPYVFWL